jgi:hypothetical protein
MKVKVKEKIMGDHPGQRDIYRNLQSGGKPSATFDCRRYFLPVKDSDD